MSVWRITEKPEWADEFLARGLVGGLQGGLKGVKSLQRCPPPLEALFIGIIFLEYMDLQGEIIIFTRPEQLMAELPETLPLGDAGTEAHRVLESAEQCETQAEEYQQSSNPDQQSLSYSILRKAHVLRRIGVELAQYGAPQIGDRFEEFLRNEPE